MASGEATNQHSTGPLLEEKGMFLFRQTWLPSPRNLTCHNKIKPPDLCDPTTLISHPWSPTRQEGKPPLGAFPAWNPLILPGATRPPGTQSRTRSLPKLSVWPKEPTGKVGGAAEALHSTGGVSGSPPGGH